MQVGVEVLLHMIERNGDKTSTSVCEQAKPTVLVKYNANIHNTHLEGRMERF